MTEHERATVLLTLIFLYELNGRTTVREVAVGAGMTFAHTAMVIDLLVAEKVAAFTGSPHGVRPLVFEVVP